MLKLHHLNMDLAVTRFVQNVERLEHLPLISDPDMLLVWGEEVVESLDLLSSFNQKKKICDSCTTSCCPSVHCELYYPGFCECPIFPLRPAICRLHYCKKFAVNDISFLKEFGDIYLNSLIEARLAGSRKAELFDSPPLARYAPGLVAAGLPLIAAFKEGRLDQASALRLIREKASVVVSPAAGDYPVTGRDSAFEMAFQDSRWYSQGHLI